MQPSPETPNRAPPAPYTARTPQVGMGEMECYERDFEVELLRSTGEYYRRRAAAWLADDTTPEYLTKAEEAVRAEEERVGAYLHASTKPKLLKEVRWQEEGVVC